MVRRKAILDLALQFDDACTAKGDLRKSYEKYEKALRETLEEEVGDEKEREEKIRQKQADDEEFMLEFERLLFRYKYPFTMVHFLTQLLIQLSQMDFNLNNENDPWELSLDIDDFDLRLTPVLRPSSSTRVEPSPSTPNPVRIILSPAGIVQAAKLLKQRDILLVVAIVKSCSPNAIGDLITTMKAN
nr:hypothetical protein [Tanacetum cinerariifolium]